MSSPEINTTDSSAAPFRSEEAPPVPLAETRSVSRRFGTNFANRNISLQIRRGEIHAIVGENGAGKTTLMNMLYGRLRPDAGDILLRGRPVSFRSPRDAILAGIGMVHQNILLFPQLSVLENVVVGFETSHSGFLKQGHARDAFIRLQEVFGFRLDPDREAWDLPFAQRQQIELLRILHRGADLFILDEPASLLAPGETERLLALLRSLRAKGRTIIFISHKLSEVFAVADRITVLRKGDLAGTFEAAETNREEIASLMVGQTNAGAGSSQPVGAAKDSGRPAGKPDRPLLQLQCLSLGPRGTEPPLKNISFSVEEGEIFGIAGVTGNGQRSLAHALAGKTRTAGNTILLNGEDISGTHLRQRLAQGIRWLPENPAEEALLPDRPIWENLLLGRQRDTRFQRFGLLLRESIIRSAKERIRENGIAASDVHELLAGLSGGNRQKVALARTLAGPLRLAVLEQPGRGLDLHASRRISQKLLELSQKRNATFIVISYDLDELLTLCDRIAVLYGGEIMGIAARAAFSSELLGKWMAGVKG